MTAQHIPADPSLKSLPINDYARLVCKIPRGFVVSRERILDFLGRRHGVKYASIDTGFTPLFKSQLEEGFFSVFSKAEDPIPYWRVVSPRGHLSDTIYMSKETQMLYLENEGVPIKRCGRSLVVENYKDRMYDLDQLPKVSTIPLQDVIFEIESANELYFDTDTGKTVDTSDDSDRFIRFPTQFEIHKYDIMKNFIDSLPSCEMQYELAGAIQGKGAFRRFRTIVNKHKLEKTWYGYLQEAYREIAIDWCKKNGLEWTE